MKTYKWFDPCVRMWRAHLLASGYHIDLYRATESEIDTAMAGWTETLEPKEAK